MGIVDTFLLGLVQGITEFLPVSSTGHLILLREAFGIETEYGLAVDATLHFATAFAVLLYFRNDIRELAKGFLGIVSGKRVNPDTRTLIWALLVGTIPAVIMGLLFEDAIETAFRSPHLVAWILIAGSALFITAEYGAKHLAEKKKLDVRKGFYVGLFQTLALLPGFSRSGATISGGMLLGLTREKAARFAFLLSFPIIIGAGALKLFELGGAGLEQGEWFSIGFSALVAFISGLLSIHYLLKFLKNHTLYVFVAYRLLLAMLVFIYL